MNSVSKLYMRFSSYMAFPKQFIGGGNKVFVLLIPTRGAFPTLYAYRQDYNKERVSYSLNLLLNTLIHKREKYLRLDQRYMIKGIILSRQKLTFIGCKFHTPSQVLSCFIPHSLIFGFKIKPHHLYNKLFFLNPFEWFGIIRNKIFATILKVLLIVVSMKPRHSQLQFF